MRNKDYLAYVSALGATFFWSFSFIWFKFAFLAYKPITIVTFRLIISTVLIGAFALAIKRLQKPARKDFKLFLLMAFFEPFAYFLGESYGLQYVSSTVAAVIVATIPLLTPLVTWYFHKEKIKPGNMFGLALSFVGVALVVLNGKFQFDASPLGVGLEFIAVFAAIAYAIVLKGLAARYNTLTIISYQNLIGAMLFLPLWFIVDFKDFMQTPFHPQAFRAIVLLAIFASTLAFIFFTQSVRQLGVTRANTFINLIPVFVAIMAFFILNDEITVQKIVGILVVVVGLFLSQVKKRVKKEEAVEIHRR